MSGRAATDSAMTCALTSGDVVATKTLIRDMSVESSCCLSHKNPPMPIRRNGSIRIYVSAINDLAPTVAFDLSHLRSFLDLTMEWYASGKLHSQKQLPNSWQDI